MPVVRIEIREITRPEATTNAVAQQRDFSCIDADATFLVDVLAEPIELSLVELLEVHETGSSSAIVLVRDIRR
jgi:hypothetical protein